MKFTELATKALRTIGAVGQGIPPSANDMQVAFEACEDMFDAFAADRLTVFQTLRHVFTLVANKGTPSNPYTIGLGGDFNVQRPTWVSDAALLVTSTNPAYEYPLAVLTPNEYAAIGIKTLGSAMATALFLDGKFDTSGVDVGLGQLFLYPVPNGELATSLVLYLPTPMTGFADMNTTDYTFPKGYAEALRYQLAKRLAAEFGKQLTPETQQLIIDTFAVIKRDNVVIPTLRADFGVPGTAGLYNWRTGTNERRGRG